MKNNDKSVIKRPKNLARKVTIFFAAFSFLGICAASAAKIVRDNAEFGVAETETVAVISTATEVYEQTTEAETAEPTNTTVLLTTEESACEVVTTMKEITTAKPTTSAPETTVKPTTTKSAATSNPKTTVAVKTTSKPKTTAKPFNKDASVKIIVVDSSATPLKTFTVKVPAGTRMNSIYLKDIISKNGYNSTGEFSGDAFFAIAESGKTYSLTAYVS